LTLRKPILALVLSILISLSFVALIQLEKNSSLTFNLNSGLACRLSFCVPAFSGQPQFEDVASEAQFPLINNSTRAEVYEFIVANPGIQFRGICTGLGIAIGTAEFHLGVLKKAGLISFFRDGKYKRFFVSKMFSVKEMKLISLLRHETTKQILKTITAQKTVSHSKLASDLSISSQGLTWQMNRLREEGIVQENCTATRVIYSLNEAYVQSLPILLCTIEC
jgi:DNA-binding transcriptional ArsR family regulator